MLFSANISIWIALHGNCSAGTTARDVSLRDTRGAERETNKNTERRAREAGRGTEREREGEREREKGGCENRENNNRLWMGDKLRNKECIHERRGG